MPAIPKDCYFNGPVHNPKPADPRTRVRNQRSALRGPRCSTSGHVPCRPGVLSPPGVAGRTRRHGLGRRFTEKLGRSQVADRTFQGTGVNTAHEN